MKNYKISKNARRAFQDYKEEIAKEMVMEFPDKRKATAKERDAYDIESSHLGRS